MVGIHADERFQTIDRVISVRDRSSSTFHSLSGCTEPGAERRPVCARVVLGMVHQMGNSRRIKERSQPYQRHDETERGRAASQAARPGGGHYEGS